LRLIVGENGTKGCESYRQVTGKLNIKGRKGEVGMSLDEVIRCLGINFLLMGYLICATLVHIAINSSKILKELEKMNKDKVS